MKKKLSFKRQLLENIDNFKYLDPEDVLKTKDDKEKEKEKDKEEATDEELEPVKRYSKPVDVRRYLQYVNAKSD